jgi:hypothetical protein
LGTNSFKTSLNIRFKEVFLLVHLLIQGVMKIDPTAQCHDPEMPANDDATM